MAGPVTPAAAAMSSMPAPWNPFSSNSDVAEARIRSRRSPRGAATRTMVNERKRSGPGPANPVPSGEGPVHPAEGAGAVGPALHRHVPVAGGLEGAEPVLRQEEAGLGPLGRGRDVPPAVE